VETNTIALTDVHGKMAGYVSVDRDITERKQAEEAQHRSEERLNGIITSAMDAIISVDTEQIVVLFNPAAEKMFGCPASEAMGKPLERFIPERFRAAHREHIRVFAETGYTKRTMDALGELRGLRADGEEFPIEASISQIELDDKKLYTVILRDITERKQAEEKLRESEEHYRLLFESNPLPMWVDDRDTLYFLAVNEAAISHYGFNRDEFLGMTIKDIRPPEEISGLLTNLSKPPKSEEWSASRKHRKKDGTLIDVEVTSHEIVFLGRQARLALVNDVTERKQAGEALKNSEIRYRRLFESAKDGILILDADTGMIVDVNPFLTKLLGYSHDLFLGKTIWELGFFKDIAANRDNFLELRQKEYIRYEDLPLETAHGQRINVEFVSNVYEVDHHKVVQCNIRDITERKQMEDELRASEAKFSAAFFSSPLALVITTLDGKFVEANPAFCNLVGYLHEEVIGNTALGLGILGAQDRERLVSALTSANGSVSNFEVQFRIRDGSLRDILYSLETISFRGALHRLSTGLDITERKHAEEELKRSNAELEQFAYVASHDLQEPLRAVAGMVQLLRQRYQGKLDERADEYIGLAFEASTRMQKLINDLLAYSRVDRYGKSFESTNVEAVLKVALANLQVAIQESNAAVLYDALPTVLADQTQLTQVFQNLIGNAIKFRGERPLQIHIGAQELDNTWQFEVRDNGIGIEPQYYERIFLVFQRLHTRREYPGTGIGLSLCKKIVERHGGRIWVESEPDQGSTFYFTIPNRR